MFSFVMKKGRSIASAKFDRPQAAGSFHCIGIGLRDGRQELGPELQTFAIANAAEARVRAWDGVCSAPDSEGWSLIGDIVASGSA